MTNETSTPDSEETRAAESPAGTTVFSDGSTFDYENGYQSNGAPVATRDRTDNPKIVQTYKIFTGYRIFCFFFWLLLLAFGVLVVLFPIHEYQISDNWNVLKTGVNNSGQVEVVDSSSTGNIIVKRPDGSVFKCDVSMVSKDSAPTGLVFCSPGAPATFSISLPHDPDNVFYHVGGKD